ncbi:hypothetical protein SSX86_028640 [Deinandra increscens subsp. villosa]|uniref:CSC1/OSCA1-like N-terminal transmembrane domain-containing protein n=1 Tax=Deinandra increscens subsp. villosa TaxID=3103831 RepID=A0AAP0CED2_9ASTR
MTKSMSPSSIEALPGCFIPRMPEPELIEHAGLDSAVYIRIYLLGLEIFVPIALLAFGVLVPVNYTGENFSIMRLSMKDLTFGEIHKFLIFNVPPASKRSESFRFSNH